MDEPRCSAFWLQIEPTDIQTEMLHSTSTKSALQNGKGRNHLVPGQGPLPHCKPCLVVSHGGNALLHFEERYSTK